MELLVLVKADAANVLEDVKGLVCEGGCDVNTVDHTLYVIAQPHTHNHTTTTKQRSLSQLD